MSDTIAIESGIPLPKSRRQEFEGLLKALNPGDSVVLPKDSNYCANLANFVLKPGGYSVRKIDATHTRIWRVK